jgi:hypothetical protein
MDGKDGAPTLLTVTDSVYRMPSSLILTKPLPAVFQVMLTEY